MFSVVLAKRLAALSILTGVCFAQTLSAPYRQTQTFKVGGEGGWDYITYDAGTNSVFVAHGAEIAVVDTATGKRRGSVPANGAHGVVILPEKSLGFSANGRVNTVTVFDSNTLQPKQEIKVGDKPDAILYDSYAKKVVVINRSDISVIDPDSLKVVATVPVPGELEAAAADASHVYVNVADTGEIAVLNAQTWMLEKRWKLDGCEDPTGLAIHEKSGTLFSACGNKKMIAVDSKTGKVITTLDTGRGTDGALVDPELGYVLFPNGVDATLSIVHLGADGKYSVVAQIPTQRGARTIATDTKTHRVFLPTAELGPPAEGQKRPSIKPGTFKILVFEFSK
jgi:DNA-binding beta-propeller fold protein YncE